MENLKEQLLNDGLVFSPIIDTFWHRFNSEDGNPFSGCYAGRFTANGTYMTVMSWDKKFKKVYKTGITNEDEIQKISKEQIEEFEKEREKEKDRVATQAKLYFDSCIEVVPNLNPYLVRKKLTDSFGAKCDKDTGVILKIPLVDENEKLWGIQTIFPNGEKRFLTGQKKKGCFHVMGNDFKTIIICEGFATAASVRQATGETTVMAIDSGNLKTVSEIFRKKYPEATIIIGGDNDISGTGQDNAKSSAKSVSGYAWIPESAGKDWSDCLIEKGEEFLKQQFNSFIKENIKYKSKMVDDFKVMTLREARKTVQTKPIWIVENLFAKDCISLIAASPKAGKSTFTRYLAACVAQGKPFLGFNSTKSKVLLLSVEEKDRYMVNGFNDLKVSEEFDENILFHVAFSPTEAIEKAEQQILKWEPDLVIFDTMFKILETEDENSYAEQTRAIGKIQNLAVSYKIHILSVHHNNKSTTPGDSMGKILGSNAIRGGFDINISIDANQKELDENAALAQRFIKTEGREGITIPKKCLDFNPETKEFSLGYTLREYADKKGFENIIDFIRKSPGPKTKSDWIKYAEGTQQERLLVIEKAIREGYLIPTEEKTKKGTPYYVFNSTKSPSFGVVESGDSF